MSITSTPSVPGTAPESPPAEPAGRHSPELAAELNRLETAERQAQDRRRQEELARQRELARFD